VLQQTNIQWDTDLIRRYDLAGPRYTSYPTALQFTDTADSVKTLSKAISERDRRKPLSLYIHIPFCAHVCYYCGCNKVVTKDRSRAEPYLQTLLKEIKLRSAELGSDVQVDQLHWGGGTPTFIDDEQTARLMQALKEAFKLRDDDQGDYAIEIDPREMTPGRLKLLRELGFNRISIGVQDVNEAVQIKVNRVQSLETTTDLLKEARELGFRSINVDLIYGLPLQTEESFAETLDRILELRPDRLSVFNYAHLPERFKPQRRINADELPDALTKLAIHHQSIEKLTATGYRNIGMDHFALPDDTLTQHQDAGTLHRNFQGYTTHSQCDLIGLGVSSISQMGDYYLQNSPNIERYTQDIESKGSALTKEYCLNADDKIRRAVITRLICDFQLDFADQSKALNIDFKEYFANELKLLEPMAQDGLIHLSEVGMDVTAAGRLLIRRICMTFDAYIDHSEQRFSKII
jgi:oxygen-independent coproporphyrinogen-3 oxidase